MQKPGKKKSETGLDDLFHCDVRVCQRDLDGACLSLFYARPRRKKRQVVLLYQRLITLPGAKQSSPSS